MKTHRLILIAVLAVILIGGDAAISRAQQGSVEALAQQILDISKPDAERQKMVADASSVDAGALITALVKGLEPGTPEEYVRIPWIWRVAIAAGRRNQTTELKSVLAASLPERDQPLHDWQAVVIGGGVVNGVSNAGAWPSDRMPELLRGEKSLSDRWNRVPDLAVAMAANEAVKTGTRYDALRILGAESWKRRGSVVTKYLAEGTHAEVQQGAIGALGDMKDKAAARALLDALPHFSDRNRNSALNALMRNDERMEMLLDAVAAGQVTRTALGDARAEKLKSAPNSKVRMKALKILGG
jgi:hypothetical protein